MPKGYPRNPRANPGTSRCRVCNHVDRGRIEIECAAARPDRAIGEQFGLKRDAIRRHWLNHVSLARKAELITGPLKIQRLAEKSLEEDRSLIDYLAILRSELFHLFLDAKSRGLTFDAASIAARLLQTLEAIGRLNGQMRQAGITVNVANSVNAGPMLILNDPSVIKMQSAIIRALSVYPEARAAVIAALRSLETQLARPAMTNGHATLSAPVEIGAIANA